jgi:hypothetical protein
LEKSISFDQKYKYNIKVALDNTYGMHLYSKLKITKHSVHYFVADDLPSIEAKITTADNFKFTLPFIRHHQVLLKKKILKSVMENF